MVRPTTCIIMTAMLAVGISAIDADSSNDSSSLYDVNESMLPDDSSQIDGALNDDGFFQDILQELGNFFNNIFGEESYIAQESSVQAESHVSDTPANIKRAIFDMNGLYSEEVVPEPSSNEYYDTAETTSEAVLQEQKEKMAFNLAMAFKNAARKKALSAGMPSKLSRLLEKRGYYKSHKRFTRSIKNLPIED